MLDDELRALVSVDAPQGFQARVQATIAARQAPTAWSHMRRLWFVPVAATAALVIAAWLNTPVETPREVEMLAGRATALAAPLPPRIESRPSAVQIARPTLSTTASPEALAAVQFDAAEGRALRALFASAPTIAIVTYVPPEDAPIVIPEISIAPLVADESSKGDRQ
jgi:hypothetical protein